MAAPYVVLPVDGEFDIGSAQMDQVAPSNSESLKVTLERLLDQFLITDQDKLVKFAEARPFWINKATMITKSPNEIPIATPLQHFNSVVSENVRSLINKHVGSMALLETDKKLSGMDLGELHHWLYLASMISKYSRLAGSFDIPYGVVFITEAVKANTLFEEDRAPKMVPTVIVNTRDPNVLKIYVLVARRVRNKVREAIVRPYGYMRLDETNQDQLLYHEYQINTSSDKILIEKVQYEKPKELTDLPKNYPTQAKSKVESLTRVTLPIVDLWIQNTPQSDFQSKSMLLRGMAMSQGRYEGGENDQKFIKLTTGLKQDKSSTYKTLRTTNTVEIERAHVTANLRSLKEATDAKAKRDALNAILKYDDIEDGDVERFIYHHERFLRHLEREFGPSSSTSSSSPKEIEGKGKEKIAPKKEPKAVERIDTSSSPTPKERANKAKKDQEIVPDDASPRPTADKDRKRLFQILKGLRDTDLGILTSPKDVKTINMTLGAAKSQAPLIDLRNYIAEIMSDAPSDALFESDDLVIFYGKPTLLDRSETTEWNLSGKEIAERIANLKTLSEVERLTADWKLDKRITDNGIRVYMTEWGLHKNSELPETQKTTQKKPTKIQKRWDAIVKNIAEKATLVRNLVNARKEEIENINEATVAPPQDVTLTPADDDSDNEDEYSDANEAPDPLTPPDSPREFTKMPQIQEDGETSAEETDGEDEAVKDFTSVGIRTPRPSDPNAPLLDKLLRLCIVDIIASFVGVSGPVAAIDAAVRDINLDTITTALFGALSAVYTGLDTSVNIRFQNLAERIGSARQTDLDLAPYLKSPLSVVDQIMIGQLLSPTLRDEFHNDNNPFGIVPLKDGSVYGSAIFGAQAILELCRESRELRPIISVSNYYYPVAQQTTSFKPLFKFDVSEPIVAKTDDDTEDQWKLIWFQAWRAQLFESYIARSPPFAEALHTEAISIINNYTPPKDSVFPIISIAAFRDVMKSLEDLQNITILGLSNHNKGRHLDHFQGFMRLSSNWGSPYAIFSIPSDKDDTKFRHRITSNSDHRSVDEAYGLLCSLWLCFSTMDIRIVETLNPIVLVDILAGSYPLKDKPASSFLKGAGNFVKSFYAQNEKIPDMPNVKVMIRPSLQRIENEGKSADKWSTQKTWLVLQSLNFAARYRLGSSGQWLLRGIKADDEDENVPEKKASSFGGYFADFKGADNVVATILSHVAEGEDTIDTWETVAALTRSNTNESMNALRPNKVDVVNFIRSAMSASDLK